MAAASRPVKPFAVGAAEKGDADAEGEAEEGQQAALPTKQAAAAPPDGLKKRRIATKSSKAQVLVNLVLKGRALAGASAPAGSKPQALPAAALDVARPLRGSKRPVLPACEAGDAYKAGAFQASKKKFVDEKKKEGMAHKDALQAWMLSDIRASLLQSLPQKELKRRRFA